VLLQRYEWPGNVRELEHAIEHAVVLSEGDVILPRALPSEVQRRDDIPDLAGQFLARHGAKRLSSAAMEALLAHSWPGNVRELEHAIEHAVLVARGEEIGPDDLPPRLRESEQKPAWRDAAWAEGSFRDARLAFEKAYFKDVLGRAQGSVSRAARLAGLHRGTLHEKLNKLGLQATATSDEAEAEGPEPEGEGEGD
jgi:DNA-binding NtrC family response regulator